MTLERVLPAYDESKRDLLLPRRGRAQGNQPPGRRPPTGIGSHTPEPPERRGGGIRLSRREALIAIPAVATATGAAILWYLDPLNWFDRHNPDTKVTEPEKPQTLEEMVAEARKMETDFKDKDLSNKQTRERYAYLLAGIIAFNSDGFITKEEILQTITWTDSLDEFVRQKYLLENNQALIPVELPLKRQEERFTTAATNNRKKSIVINAGGELFKQQSLDRVASPVFPRDWNVLKMLRLSLLHEFNHLVSETTDPLVVAVLDPKDLLHDRRCEGFRFQGADQNGMFNAIFEDFHEATIEFISKNLNLKYFGSFVSNYTSFASGKDISMMIGNLERVLQAAGVTFEQLKNFHQKSQLKEFLFLLMKQSGAPDNTPEEVLLRVGLDLVTAVEDGNQTVIQNYINQVGSLHKG